jgi:hypothetical protein
MHSAAADAAVLTASSGWVVDTRFHPPVTPPASTAKCAFRFARRRPLLQDSSLNPGHPILPPLFAEDEFGGGGKICRRKHKKRRAGFWVYGLK